MGNAAVDRDHLHDLGGLRIGDHRGALGLVLVQRRRSAKKRNENRGATATRSEALPDTPVMAQAVGKLSSRSIF